MKISIASDHAGYVYKEAIKKHLHAQGHEVQDFGTDNEERCDYPDYIRPAAKAVAGGECERGIVLGGSGNGEAMSANKVEGIRCALCWNRESARLSRRHNDSNIISVGARLVSLEMAIEMIDLWLKEPYDGGRHQPRIDKIEPFILK
ncbi:MAG: ribose 5-phosphate isomerase B [Planctomycetota bacterium]